MTEKTLECPPETLEDLQKLVVLQLRAGAFDAAAIVLHAYLQEHPEDGWVQSELCRCLLRLERWEDAEQILAHKREHAPDAPDLLALEGLSLQLQGGGVEARAKYEAALGTEPMLSWAAYNLAQIAAAEGDEEVCERWLDALIEEEPGHFAARFQRALMYGRTLRAEESQAELIETINANPLMLQPYLLLSELRLRDGKAHEAIELLVHGLQANPLAHGLREALARVFATQGDGEAAFGVRLELCRLRGRAEDFLDLGVSALQMGSQEHAVVAFGKAIKEAPGDWRGYYNLAEIHRGAGDYKGSFPLYQMALECGPCDRVHNGLALWHMEGVSLEEGERPKEASLERAREHLDEALLLSPEMPEALYNRVLLYGQLEDSEGAKLAYETLEALLSVDDPLRDSLEELRGLLG